MTLPWTVVVKASPVATTHQQADGNAEGGSMKNKPWRLAFSLHVLREQINEMFPDRDKLSDGSIGDAIHESRRSDHNPWVKLKQGSITMGIVTAIDITYDPEHGVDCTQLAEVIKLDSRVKYVIWNKMIYNPTVKLAWRHYRGINPHTRHMHVSVMPSPKFFDDQRKWLLT